MNSKSLKQKLVRFFKGKQGGAVPTAIKVLTAVVCGAVIMMGLYGVVTGVVLPASSDKVNSMFSYEAEGGAGGGGYGGGTGTPETPTMLNGDGQTVNTAAFAPLTFRSSTPYDTFQSVKVDGEVVESSNYTVTEGSTIVTFDAEYTKNLSAGEHTIEIVSSVATVDADFNVVTENVLPEGAKYYLFDGLENCPYCGYQFTDTPSTCECGCYSNKVFKAHTVLEAGDAFPAEIVEGGVFEYGDYQYHYGSTWCLCSTDSWLGCQNGCGAEVEVSGWAVRVIDSSKSSYDGMILESLLGEPVVSMRATYANCTSLVNADNIVIPDSVNDTYAAFMYCESLTSAPIIPDNVTDMYAIFESCTSLAGNVVINADNLDNSGDIFNNTAKDIVLSGDCPVLSEIAAAYDNVTVAE